MENCMENHDNFSNLWYMLTVIRGINIIYYDYVKVEAATEVGMICAHIPSIIVYKQNREEKKNYNNNSMLEQLINNCLYKHTQTHLHPDPQYDDMEKIFRQRPSAVNACRGT